MTIDPTNPVVALCARGMAIEGDAAQARALFEQAWSERRNDYDACIAAHFVARHQADAEATLHWNSVAVRHAEAVMDESVVEFMASLYLNLADSYAALGRDAEANAAAVAARTHLAAVPAGGYRDFIEYGIDRVVNLMVSPDRSY
jgi:hypothetical protein